MTTTRVWSSRWRFWGALGLVAILALASCQSTRGLYQNGVDKIQVVTTVGMITDIVRNVGREHVNAIGLMGPGIDPHNYRPSARDILRLDNADIIFYGGLHLEGRMVDVFEKTAETGRPVFAVSSQIDPQRLRKPIEFEGQYDPHIWFDVTLWMEAVRMVQQSLCDVDRQRCHDYTQNATVYLQQLSELHQYVQTRINEIPPQSRVLITAHDAFGYFGDQYGMEVHGLQGTSTASETGAGSVRDLAQFIVDRKIKAIFVESSVPAKTIEAVQAAVRSRGWDVRIGGSLFSDAMGNNGTIDGTYIGMVRHNVDTIVKALK